MVAPYGHSPSVEGTDHDHDHDSRENELGALLSRLQLDRFGDKSFAKSIRHALRRMYHSQSIWVNGTQIPRSDVRSAMQLLTIDHIDFVERQLHEATGSVTWGEGFLISCLYNAPLDCMAKSRCGG